MQSIYDGAVSLKSVFAKLTGTLPWQICQDCQNQQQKGKSATAHKKKYREWKDFYHEHYLFFLPFSNFCVEWKKGQGNKLKGSKLEVSVVGCLNFVLNLLM